MVNNELAVRFENVDSAVNSPLEQVEIQRMTISKQADYRLVVSSGGIDRYLFDLYLPVDEADCFHAAKVGDDFIVFGYGEGVHMYNLQTKQLTSIKLEGYFAYLYSWPNLNHDQLSDWFLVASASRLYCINRQGQLIWRSAQLGVDGVVVEAIENGVIKGQGEWDPPGGWLAYTIDGLTGKLLNDSKDS